MIWFYCAVCAYRWVPSGDQGPWRWSVLWLHMQAGWNRGCCHCNRCAHVLRQGRTSCRFDKPSWPFPEGKLLVSVSSTRLLSCILQVYNVIGICFAVQVLTAIGNFCICSIAIGMVVEIIVMYPIQHRDYRPGIDNLLVLLIGGIPIAMPTVLSVTMAIGSHRLAQQVYIWTILSEVKIYVSWSVSALQYCILV